MSAVHNQFSNGEHTVGCSYYIYRVLQQGMAALPVGLSVPSTVARGTAPVTLVRSYMFLPELRFSTNRRWAHQTRRPDLCVILYCK